MQVKKTNGINLMVPITLLGIDYNFCMSRKSLILININKMSHAKMNWIRFPKTKIKRNFVNNEFIL